MTDYIPSESFLSMSTRNITFSIIGIITGLLINHRSPHQSPRQLDLLATAHHQPSRQDSRSDRAVLGLPRLYPD